MNSSWPKSNNTWQDWPNLAGVSAKMPSDQMATGGYMRKAIMKHTAPKQGSSCDLFDAIMAGKLAEVKRCVQIGIKVNQCKDDTTPLMFAVLQGNRQITDYLIRQGADVNLRNDIGQTALMIAALGGHKSIIEQLVLAGADVQAIDKDGRNAIAWATSRGDFPDVVSLLAVFGTDYNIRDLNGLTPLMRAALLGYADSVGALLTLGADEKVKFRGKTAYEMAFEKGYQEVCKTMKAILENRPKGHAL